VQHNHRAQALAVACADIAQPLLNDINTLCKQQGHVQYSLIHTPKQLAQGTAASLLCTLARASGVCSMQLVSE
jgi:hypothetical protein